MHNITPIYTTPRLTKSQSEYSVRESKYIYIFIQYMYLYILYYIYIYIYILQTYVKTKKDYPDDRNLNKNTGKFYLIL